MSYSFTVRAATKAEASLKVADEFAKIVVSQPTHEADQKQAQAVADAFINILEDVEDKDISVSMSGSLGWNGVNPTTFTRASVNINASLVIKE